MAAPEPGGTAKPPRSCTMLWWISMLWAHRLHPQHTCLPTLPLLSSHLHSLPPCKHTVCGDSSDSSHLQHLTENKDWTIKEVAFSLEVRVRAQLKIPSTNFSTETRYCGPTEHHYHPQLFSAQTNALATFGTSYPWKRGKANFKTRMRICLCTDYPDLAGEHKHAAPETPGLCVRCLGSATPGPAAALRALQGGDHVEGQHIPAQGSIALVQLAPSAAHCNSLAVTCCHLAALVICFSFPPALGGGSFVQAKISHWVTPLPSFLSWSQSA